MASTPFRILRRMASSSLLRSFSSFHSRFQPTGHPVERVRQLTDLTVLSGFQPDSVTALGNLPGRLDDLINGVCNEPGKAITSPAISKTPMASIKIVDLIYSSRRACSSSSGTDTRSTPQSCLSEQERRNNNNPCQGCWNAGQCWQIPLSWLFYFLPVLMIFPCQTGFPQIPQYGAIHVDNGDTDFLPPGIFFGKRHHNLPFRQSPSAQTRPGSVLPDLYTAPHFVAAENAGRCSRRIWEAISVTNTSAIYVNNSRFRIAPAFSFLLTSP